MNIYKWIKLSSWQGLQPLPPLLICSRPRMIQNTSALSVSSTRRAFGLLLTHSKVLDEEMVLVHFSNDAWPRTKSNNKKWHQQCPLQSEQIRQGFNTTSVTPLLFQSAYHDYRGQMKLISWQMEMQCEQRELLLKVECSQHQQLCVEHSEQCKNHNPTLSLGMKLRKYLMVLGDQRKPGNE